MPYRGLIDDGDNTLAKSVKPLPLAAQGVRTRRAYFDCKFGQLHVRTAFPGTGGFDEQVTLVCVHGARASSRTFARFLPEIGDVRSVYAPDLPGCGESDPSPSGNAAEAASAIVDLARDLRLRQIDVLGLQWGAAVAVELGAAQPELVRRLVLIALPSERLTSAKQPALILRTKMDAPDSMGRAKAALPAAKFLDALDYAEDLFDAAPKTLAKDIGGYLSGRV
jgi:pimeloyl-ACP methyl ester carboxylesterase